jgi:hypothetical protein
VTLKIKSIQTLSAFARQRNLTPSSRKILMGFPGFLGFLGFNAFQAFPNHNPLYFFLFSLFALFVEFRCWKDPLKYLGLSGLLGLIVPALYAAGLFKV